MRLKPYGIFFLICALLTASGCLHRSERQQGNIIEKEQVDKIKIGTSQAQVKSYMGAPLLLHPTDPNQWIYVYQRRLSSGKFFRKHFILTFDSQGKVIAMKKHNIEANPTSLKDK
jgi:outer membrane protein assembly factor BamE